MARRIKRLAWGLAGSAAVATVALGAVVGLRALRLAGPSSEAPPPAAPLSVDERAVAERLAGAVRIPTESYEEPERFDRSRFFELHAYLERTYPRVHAVLRCEVVGEASLLFTWPGRDASLDPLVLMAHLDVVPAPPETWARWTYPPYGGIVAGGFVWGRGAMDDKGGLIAMLEAAEALLAEGFVPRRTVYLALGHDEEVGGRAGARAIAETLAARGVRRYALVVDEGGAIVEGLLPGLERRVALVGVAEKGYVNVRLTARAEGGHSSTPPPETAIGVLARALARLEASPFPARLDGVAREMVVRLAPAMGFGARVAAANLWLFRPLVERRLLARPQSAALLRTTIAPTLFHAGVKANVLPTEASAVVNLRIRPGETVETVTARLRAVVADDRVGIERYGAARDPSPVADLWGPGFELIARTARQVSPEDPPLVAPVVTVGGTDAWYFAQRSAAVYRFLPVVMTADDFRRVHGVDERLAVESLVRSVRFFAQLVRNAAAP
jgi:carboxypeptidase PM20D1